MFMVDASYYKLLEIVYEYFSFVEKKALPTSIHDYIHELIEKGILQDMWGDWQYYGWTWYSWKLAGQILDLIKAGILEETCTKDGHVCGLLQLKRGKKTNSIFESGSLVQN